MRALGAPEPLSAAAALDRLAAAIGGAPGGAATLLVVTRTGAMAFEFRPGTTRRYAPPPAEASRAFEALPPTKVGRPAQPAVRDAAAAGPAQPNGPDAAAQEAPERIHTAVEAPPVPREIRAILDPSRAGRLLEGIGILTPSGQIRRDERRKYNQIVHLVALAVEALAGLPRERLLTVVDCGCGKSQLLFILNHVMTEGLRFRAQFVGLDTSPQAIAAARGLQARLGYANMAFEQAAIRAWEPAARPDVVLSLHACDTATDEAIALGIAARSPVIIAVPCCQAELAAQLEGKGGELHEALAHGVLRRRFGDWATDALRALYLEASGYAVDVLEYVSPLDTPKNTMIRARHLLPAGQGERRGTGAEPPAVGSIGAAARAFEAMCVRFGLDPSLPRLRASLERRLDERLGARQGGAKQG